jgi:uncharacterized membrane protein (UPF0127 family)
MRSRARSLPIVLAAAAALASAACQKRSPEVVLHGEKGPTRVRVELALSGEQRSRGLMWRDQLDADAGMLFVFSHNRELSFWMKNTPLPLDIIYIGADRRVVSVAEKTTPYSLTSIPSRGRAKYVLEVNAGLARAHGVGVGTRVDLPELPSQPSTD